MSEVEITNVGGPRGVASEATLLRLLDAAKQNGSSSVAARTAQRVQENYNKAQAAGTGIFSKAAQAAKGLADELIRGGDRVSDFTRHVLGSNSMFQRLVEFGDDAVDQFRSLSSVGASFSNSIFDMTTTAATAGMRLDEFYRSVQSNSEILRMLGGTVTDGARRFADLSKNLRSGDVGRQLFDMGYTISDINDGMLTYIENQALQGRLENMSRQDLIRGSREYLQEIDLLAKATGQSREAIMNQTNELQNNAEFQALISRAGDGADQLTNNMAAVAGFLPGFTSDLLSIADGFEGSQLAIALNQMGSSGQAFLNLLQQADSMSEQDFLRGLSDIGPGVADAITAQFDTTQMRLLRERGSPIAAIFDALSGMRRMGNINVDQMIAEQEQRDQITSILSGFSDALARIKSEVLDALLESAFADQVREMSTSLGRFLTSLFGGETPGGVITGTAGSAVSAFQSLADYLIGPEGILTRISAAFTTELDAFTAAINGGTPPMDYLRERAGELGTDLKNWFNDMFFGPMTDEFGNRSGGLLDTITTGFNNIFELAKEKFLEFAGIDTSEGAPTVFEQLVTTLSDSISEIFNGPLGQQLTSTISYYFEGLMLSLQEAIDDKLGILSNDRLARERREFEERGLREGRIDPAQATALQEYAADLARIAQGTFDMIVGSQGIWQSDESYAREIARFEASPMRQAQMEEIARVQGLLTPTTRRIGTLQATGRLTEPADTTARIHQGERVLNPSEAGAVNGLPDAINQLNTLTAQVRDLMAQSLQYQERTARGIRRLGGDIMGAA